jgi:ferric-dicitrate binding protein FerR (iron transport regulator)
MLHDGDAVITTATGRAEWSLNPGAYLQAAPGSFVRVKDTGLDRMHFDLERGEVYAEARSADGAALVIRAPPGLLTVKQSGHYHVRVEEGARPRSSWCAASFSTWTAGASPPA